MSAELPPPVRESIEPPDARHQWIAWLYQRRQWLIGALVLVILVLLFEALRALTRELDFAQVLAAVRGTTSTQHALAILAMVISYVALTGYDWSALSYVGAVLPYRIVAQASFIAYALGNTIGIGVLTGGSVRMRIYGAAGVEAGTASRAIAFNAIAFGLGMTALGAGALFWGAPAIAHTTHLHAVTLRLIAAVLMAAIGLFLLHCWQSRQYRAFGLTLQLPTFSLALQQLAISALDIAASAAVLWVLLPHGAVGFPVFVAYYAVATLLGVISHVPGGVGVFEAVILAALAGRVPAESLAGALVLYRLIYYVLPLSLALVLLLANELRRGAVAPVQRAAISLSPLLLAAYTLIVGVVLLISGVTPTSEDAIELLALHVPLPLVEASHFIGSISGLGLLFVARGMVQRLDAAWWAGMAIAIVSLVMAFPKGIALTEAAMLAFLVGALAISRRQFTRRAALLAQPFTGGWLLAVGGILAAVAGILVFVYRDVAYVHELWWQFEFDGNAPRSLRALVAVALLTLTIAIRHLLRPRMERLDLPDSATLDRVEHIVQAQESAQACLALMGDKYIVFSASGNAFVMFGRHGRSWISLFDPVGPQEEWPDLVWQFIERARESGGRPSFYQVRPQNLPLYLDTGLRLFKLGEDAYVPLAEFSLRGKNRANLRAGVNRAEREGLSFELVPLERVPQFLAEVRLISDAWLAKHRTAEKGFSLGAFDEAYVRRQPLVLVRVGGRVVAFATVMCTAQKSEASVDLMRHMPDAPRGTMDFLFVRLMAHCQAEGYQRFGLGMAPLSGMERHPLAPHWHRVGRMLFAHGEHFYNFQGLRAFKEKFDPTWEARYLASPGGTAPLLVLTDIAALISGGLKGVIAK